MKAAVEVATPAAATSAHTKFILAPTMATFRSLDLDPKCGVVRHPVPSFYACHEPFKRRCPCCCGVRDCFDCFDGVCRPVACSELASSLGGVVIVTFHSGRLAPRQGSIHWHENLRQNYKLPVIINYRPLSFQKGTTFCNSYCDYGAIHCFCLFPCNETILFHRQNFFIFAAGAEQFSGSPQPPQQPATTTAAILDPQNTFPRSQTPTPPQHEASPVVTCANAALHARGRGRVRNVTQRCRRESRRRAADAVVGTRD